MSGFEPFGTQSKNNVLEWIAEDYWSKENQNRMLNIIDLTKYNNNNNSIFYLLVEKRRFPEIKECRSWL